jgi:hypothetical protein
MWGTFLYASVVESGSRKDPTVTVRAPAWMRGYLTLFPVALAIVLVVVASRAGSNSINRAFLVLIGLVGVAIFWKVSSLYLQPFVEAGRAGIRGRGLGAVRRLRWNELSEVIWTHRMGRGLYTRTELLVRRSGASEIERFCVLHFLRGRWLGRRASRIASEEFLPVCRRHGVEARSGWDASRSTAGSTARFTAGSTD